MPKIRTGGAAAVVLATVSCAHAQDAVQWRVEDGGNGHWYASVAADTWNEANLIARKAGAGLATISSEFENAFVLEILLETSAKRGYLGLQQLDDQSMPDEGWYWDDGTALDFTNWTDHNGLYSFVAPDDTPCNVPPYLIEDNQANIAMIERDGRWDDLERGLPCDARFTRIAILEFSADCNSDGVVDYGQILDGTFDDINDNGVPDCCDDATCTSATQWTVEEGGNGRWYQPVTVVDATWTDARIMAETAGATLASVTSAEKTIMLNQLMLGWTWAYVGGINVDGAWSWLNGDEWEYANWVPGNPGNDPNEVVIELRIFGDINDIDPDRVYESHYRAILEWSADCNNDGIVDYGQILDGTYADEDGNGVPDCCEGACPGDLNGDDRVDSADLGLLIAAWNTDGSIVAGSDINEDGIVNAADLGLQIGNWGDCGCN